MCVWLLGCGLFFKRPWISKPTHYTVFCLFYVVVVVFVVVVVAIVDGSMIVYCVL